MKKNSFPKSERLCSKKDIDLLFRSGAAVRQGVILAKWLKMPDAEGSGKVQVLIAVPKSRVPRAVDRNRVKRRIRELYRTNKIDPSLYRNTRLLIAFVYGGDSDVSFTTLKEAYFRVVERLELALGKPST